DRCAEQNAVELTDERTAILVEEHRDDQLADDLAARRAQLLDERGPLPRRLAEQRGAAHDRRPLAVALAQRAVERLAELYATERIGLKERKLPPVERGAEARVVVRAGEAHARAGRDRRAEGIEPRRLAGRRRRCNRENGTNPERPPVEALEQHRSG